MLASAGFSTKNGLLLYRVTDQHSNKMNRSMDKIKCSMAMLALLVGAHGVANAQDVPRWSWQEPQAKVLPTGDLEWAPKTFEFTAGRVGPLHRFRVGQRRQRRTLEADALEAPSLGPQRRRQGKGLQGRAHLRLQAGRRSIAARWTRNESGSRGRPHHPDPGPVLGRRAGGHLRFGGGDRLEAGRRQHASSPSRRRSGTWTSTGRRATSGWSARTAP